MIAELMSVQTFCFCYTFNGTYECWTLTSAICVSLFSQQPLVMSAAYFALILLGRLSVHEDI